MAAYGDTEMTELGRSLAQTLCQQSLRPDGIVAINDALGIGLMSGLHEARIRVPEEISRRYRQYFTLWPGLPRPDLYYAAAHGDGGRDG